MATGWSGMGKFATLFGRPAFLRGFHGPMTLARGVLVPVTVFTGLKS